MRLQGSVYRVRSEGRPAFGRGADTRASEPGQEVSSQQDQDTGQLGIQGTQEDQISGQLQLVIFFLLYL